MKLTWKHYVGGLFVFGIIGSIFNQPSEDVKARNIANAQAHAAEVKKKQNELLGIDCTKDGQALIGESQARTLKCGWGKAKRINRTTNQNGTREQWVYDGNNYLYFTNGRLTSIQN